MQRLDGCMLVDQGRAKKRLEALRKRERRRQPIDRSFAEIERTIDASIKRCEQRRHGLPRPSLDADLPILARRDEIAAAIEQNQVVVVCGETGSGKTTQLPQICLSLGRGVTGMIGHTQPRRIAARSVADRMAMELGAPGAVGYKVRFGDHTGPGTYVKVMTDGILLAETQSDHRLEHYDTLIIDEAHERSLNIDFLLGYIHRLLPRRPELRLIVTSATIDPESFSRHFDDAPVIEVSGRTYPVEHRYRQRDADADANDAIVEAVHELCGLGPGGDILVFLAGEREIREAASALRKAHLTETEILPLYARLSGAEQQRVFASHPGRRIILATNVAETSLTVPGIRYVVDPGDARISRYNARHRIQGLQVEPVSQASANQRAGRCGRVAPGVCIRLYSEADHAARDAYTAPEILRTNLASAILQMKSLHLGDIEQFPFLDPPKPGLVRDGVRTLTELGALDSEGELTSLGRSLAKLPVDPRLGRMLLAGAELGCLKEILVIAAALSIQDPRERPVDNRDAADAAHDKFRDESSDFTGWLKLWTFFREQREKLSRSKLRHACRQNFLAFSRMWEWQDVHRQLMSMLLEMGHRAARTDADPEAVHRALLTGLLGSIGRKSDRGSEYEGVNGNRFNLSPGSGLFRQKPKWVMADELVRTTKLWARTAARIEPTWIEEAGAHLVRRSYDAPRWDRRTQRVIALERVSLYGLDVVKGRNVHYGPIEPEVCRQIFLHEGLVEGTLNTKGGFLRHNQDLMDEIRGLEAKARRDDLLADAQSRYAFYDQRVPDDVYSGKTFERWRRRAEQKEPKLLWMCRGDLMRGQDLEPDAWPDRMAVERVDVRLSYKHDPGHRDDGVTMRVPIEALGQVSATTTDWLVPGMVQEKAAELLRTLPRSLRRQFDVARLAGEFAARGAEPVGMVEALTQFLDTKGVNVPADAWDLEQLPAHLRMNFRIVDGQGRTQRSGRDLAELRKRLGVSADLERLPWRGERSRLTGWDFDDLEQEVSVRRGGDLVTGFPAIVDEGSTVSLRLLVSRESATRVSRSGVRRLFMLRGAVDLERIARAMPGIEKLGLLHAPLGSGEELRRDLLELIADRAYIGETAAIRTKESFDTHFDEGWNRLRPACDEVCDLARRILEQRQRVAVLCDSLAGAFPGPVEDVRVQARALTSERFLVVTPFAWLRQLPRYLHAAAIRLQRQESGSRDHERRLELGPYLTRYAEIRTDHTARGVVDPELDRFRWMLEEMRVSLFAQKLGTSIPVSAKRLDAQLNRISR